MGFLALTFQKKKEKERESSTFPTFFDFAKEPKSKTNNDLHLELFLQTFFLHTMAAFGDFCTNKYKIWKNKGTK